jgi:DNA polymerase I
MTENDFLQTLLKLRSEGLFFAIDTETTGLSPHKADKLFSVIVTGEHANHYFSFKDYPAAPGLRDWLREKKSDIEVHDFYMEEKAGLSREWIRYFDIILNDPLVTVFMQNAKFDWAFLENEGCDIKCQVYDTEVLSRASNNILPVHSLNEQAKREFGKEKIELMRTYMDEFKLFTEVMKPGAKKPARNYHFDLVPHGLTKPYGLQDGNLTLDLGMLYFDRFGMNKPLTPEQEKRSIQAVMRMESKLIPVCYRMEKRGIMIDREYCKRAEKHEAARILKAEAEFKALTGLPELVNSGECLGPAFIDLGYTPGKTPDGSWAITDTFLKQVKHPLSQAISDYRDASKRCNTYFRGFLWFADQNDVVHANIKQAGTLTGRFSYKDPNLQNQKNDDESAPFPIRRAFIPRPGHFFLSVDYDQMELKLMLDYAEEMGLIERIKAGHDAHQATADMTGLSRKAAKNVNFGLGYGMGLDALALKIGCSKDDARKFRQAHNRELPNVKRLINAAKEKAERQGFVTTYLGRKLLFPDKAFSYKAINGVIQGSAADIVKLAMIELDQFLADKKTKMLVQVHDEIIFEVPFSEYDIADSLISIMAKAYTPTYLPLTCSSSFGLESWQDMKSGNPREHFGEEAGNRIQRANIPEA